MSGRGRPALSIGTYGNISTRSTGTKQKPNYIARARFRDTDGVSRPVTASGQTKRAAEDALKVKLSKRQRAVEAAAISSAMTVRELADRWIELGAAGQLGHAWATNTVERYKLAVGQIKTQLGARRVSELNRAGVNTALSAISAANGPGAAKSAKSALSGMCKLALLYDALDANPVRDSMTIPQRRKEAPRALTPDETTELVDKLRSDEDAVNRYDLADLVEFMLGTGARIGEVCAARDEVLDLDSRAWEINATIVRVKGHGLVVQPRPKTAAGWRVLALPQHAVDIIQRREGELRLAAEGIVFGSPNSRSLRDPSNTAGDLREVLDRLGYEWVTSHVFRKTVATRLEEAGYTPRQVADHLGHANPSMTLDVYFGRSVALADAAAVLNLT